MTWRRGISEAVRGGQVDGLLTRREVMRPLALVAAIATPTTLMAGCSSGPDRRRREINVLDYGADPTGARDSTAAFRDAIAALPPVGGSAAVPTGGGWVYAPTGHYKITSTLNFTQFQNLRGDGKSLTIFNYSGKGPCILAANSAGTTTSGWPAPCQFEGFTIDGTGAGPGAIGIQIGNLFHSRGHDLEIQSFLAAGATGVLFKNHGKVPVADRMQWSIDLIENANHVVFDGNCAVGVGSFSYAEYEFSVVANQDQKILTLQNNAVVRSSRMSIVGGVATNSSSNTGWVIGMDVGAPSNQSTLRDCEFLISVEADAGVGLRTHQSIRMESNNLGELSGTGVLNFIPGFTAGIPYPFQPASIAAGSIFAVSGRVSESALGTMSFEDCANFQGGTQRKAYVVEAASISSPFRIVPQKGDVQEFMLPNTNVTIAGFHGAPYVMSRSLELLFHQPASGAPCSVTWPPNIKWANGKSALSTVNGAVDKVRMDYFPHTDIWFAELLTS
ncbi:glycosyl hydrolase family 28-related protein [Mycobacterium conspicuum]|uniref:glycosyl hydrolase family 28-related protein n=1 Tax=Mycobacterium conspicuum TaxID=44010 RepID=UPI0013D14D1B|nr:glycosyl hydrolase family 28-related protein [Mycobacterium conspicuum]